MKPFWDNGVVQLYKADAREIPLPDGSVHCVVTSPPYFGLRVYKDNDSWEGGDSNCDHTAKRTNPTAGSTLGGGKNTQGHSQESYAGDCHKCVAIHVQHGIGLEASVEAYIANLVDVFREVKRVLRDDGVCWVNLGDSYGRDPAKGQHKPGDSGKEAYIYDNGGGRASSTFGENGTRLGIPERVVLALQADGWIWRDTIIWAKKSAMPESLAGWRFERCRVKVSGRPQGTQSYGEPLQEAFNNRRPDHSGDVFDAAIYEPCPGCPKCAANDGLVLRKGSWRTTSSHEYIFMLTKSMGYYADGEAVKTASLSDHPSGNGYKRDARLTRQNADGSARGNDEQWQVTSTANRRSVWNDISPEPYGGKHFATFPSSLPRICIQASTSEAGCCSECGMQWARVVDKIATGETQKMADGWDTGPGAHGTIHREGREAGEVGQPVTITQTLGWRATCGCNAPAIPSLVLDPFAGTATTCLAAQKLGRRAAGTDISEAYLQQAVKRLEAVPLPLATQPQAASGPGV